MNYELLIVDDHPLYRAALRGAIAAAYHDCDFFEADSVTGLFECLERHPRPDLMLLDLNLPAPTASARWRTCVEPTRSCRSS